MKMAWVDSDDASTSEIREFGSRLIDRIGGSLMTEVARTVAKSGLETAAEELHLQKLELPAPLPGKPKVTAIKRTSYRIRSPLNKPDAADQAALAFIRNELNEGNSPPRVLVQRVEAPGHPAEYRVYKPIALMPECLLCHGSADSIQPGVRLVIERRFPEDRALDYNAYDWRGVIRVSLAAP